MKKHLFLLIYSFFLTVFAFGDDEQIKRFVANEENLTGVALWEDNAAIEKRFGVKFKRYCDPIKDGDCDHHPLTACIETDGYYIVFISYLQSNFETVDGIRFQRSRPKKECVKSSIREIKTTMIGKPRTEIFNIFGKASYEGIYENGYLYDTKSVIEWSKRYKIDIIKWESVDLEIKNDRVVAYGIFKGGEPSPDSYIKKDK
ncbi:MAG: hypothetical protein LBO72_00675 [Helicobacteraceae bacterium]|nr:hypothetical protein [Helicobacteraceae bacterium]